jgi:hypothetical protein
MTTSITLNGHPNRHVRRMAVRSLRVRRICPECRRPALVDLRAAFCSPACERAAYRRRLQQGHTRASSVMSYCRLDRPSV